MTAALLETLIASFPASFGLKAFPNRVFRIAPPIGKGGSSYVNNAGALILYVQIKGTTTGAWSDWAKGDAAELRNEIVAPEVKAPATKSTTVGTCVVCAREIAVTKSAKLVHHGYKRPGVGFIMGDCFAVAMAPHELSLSTAHAYAKHCARIVRETEDYRARLQSGQVDTMTGMEEWVPVPTTAPRYQACRDPGWTTGRVVYTSTETSPERAQRFAVLLQAAITECGAKISYFKGEIVRMGERVASWTPADLRQREEVIPTTTRRRSMRRRSFFGGSR